MPGMKRDLGGAAAILGGFYAAVKAGFNQNLHAVFCLAENAVGPKSTRPDDIYTLYSGKSVEINNTDAEGRLVLSDGVVYADRDLKAEIILGKIDEFSTILKYLTEIVFFRYGDIDRSARRSNWSISCCCINK